MWDFWWVARQAEHLSNPFFTRFLAAPVGAQLGFHSLMPLPGLILTPVTLAFGPAVSYNLLSAIMPGLLCYAMYRVARLWVPSQTGAIAAGAFFGLSSMLVYQSWYLLNLAVGSLFIPLALEAAVRLRRRPAWRQAVILGVVLGASLLTDQESAVLAIIAATLALLPWLTVRPAWAKVRQAVLAALVAAVVASPQIIAMAQQAAAGGASAPPRTLAASYPRWGIRLPGMFAPSPRAAFFGLHSLVPHYQGAVTIDTVPTYGAVLSILAVAGLILSRRRRHAWLIALLWAGCSILALGSVLYAGRHAFVPDAIRLDGVRLSGALPFTWFVRIPGLAGFREADRFAFLGIAAAALLAGSAVDWLRHHAAPALIVVLVLAIPEAGSSGNPGYGSMPAALPAVDHPIAADHSGSLVVDVPFGTHGGVKVPGAGAAFASEAEVLATYDGHPRGVAYLSRIPIPTVKRIGRHPFYAALLRAQTATRGFAAMLERPRKSADRLLPARRDARRMDVGWVLVWPPAPHVSAFSRRAVIAYLRDTGFRFAYRADGVLVYRAGGRTPR